jgi:hypothetical protein
MKKILFLSLFFPLISFAKQYGTVSCLIPQYGYINGILNESILKAKQSSSLIQNSLSISYEVKTLYNQSEGATIDLLRALFQKIEESKDSVFFLSKRGLIITYGRKVFGYLMDVENKSSDNLFRLVLSDNQKNVNQKILNSYDKNKKLIIFSHSQGNLYANKACDDLPHNTFENIQIATPSAKVKCGDPNHYTSIHTDEMIQIVRKLGVPFSVYFNAPIMSPLSSNVPQINSTYKINNPNIPIPTSIDELESLYKMIEKHDFSVHTINNYLSNPPSLSKIKKDHKDVLKNNFQVSSQNIINSDEIVINCDNIDEFTDTKIPITRMPASVIGKTIELDKNEKKNFYIEKKGDSYQVSDIDLDTWVAKKFWWLYILAFPFALMILGTVASSVKKSEEWTNRDKRD